jgi:hypothetical protein
LLIADRVRTLLAADRVNQPDCDENIVYVSAHMDTARTKAAYETLASMLAYQSIEEICGIFVQTLIAHLTQSKDPNIIDKSLEVLHSYL